MERETNPQSTVHCRMGCGFYGNPAFEGMCSKCYKDSLKRKQSSPPLSGRASPSPGTGSSATNVVSSPQLCSASGTTTTIAIPKHETEATNSIALSGVAASATGTPEKSVQNDTDDSDLNTSSQSLPSGSDAAESPDGKAKKRNRCTSCRKKVGLTGFECRCGGLFCGLHRYSDKHGCSYDYKADAREMIAKQNPVVVGEKVKKI